MTPDDSLTLAVAELSDPERRYVHAFLDTMSAQKAGAASGLPDDAIKRPALRRVVGQALALRSERHADIRSGAIQALWLMATYDVADCFRGGLLLPPNELPPSVRSAVTSFRQTAYGMWEYKFTDRAKILSMILDHFRQIDSTETATDKVEVIYYGD